MKPCGQGISRGAHLRVCAALHRAAPSVVVNETAPPSAPRKQQERSVPDRKAKSAAAAGEMAKGTSERGEGIGSKTHHHEHKCDVSAGEGGVTDKVLFARSIVLLYSNQFPVASGGQ